jgi:hypothetical protein
MQRSAIYIAVQQRVPRTSGAHFKEQHMTKILSSAQPSADKVHEVVAEVFQAATIALVGVLGILTVAATI